jgi:hypothetical protein
VTFCFHIHGLTCVFLGVVFCGLKLSHTP